MNKFIYALLFGVLTLSSCGSEEKSPAEEEAEKNASNAISICDCAQVSLDMMKEMKAADGDESIIKEIQKGYEADIEICTALGEKMQRKMEGLSDKEKKAMSEEMMKKMESCDAYQEMMRDF